MVGDLLIIVKINALIISSVCFEKKRKCLHF
jgi:hypothetical protein